MFWTILTFISISTAGYVDISCFWESAARHFPALSLAWKQWNFPSHFIDCKSIFGASSKDVKRLGRTHTPSSLHFKCRLSPYSPSLSLSHICQLLTSPSTRRVSSSWQVKAHLVPGWGSEAVRFTEFGIKQSYYQWVVWTTKAWWIFFYIWPD